MKITIPNAELVTLIQREPEPFPKYATQIINLANLNAQGTRPKIVGQQTELIQEFPGKSMDEWEQWYLERYPNAIDEATDRIYAMVERLRDAIAVIDRSMVERWVRDLILVKTYLGLRFQEAILCKVAEVKQVDFRLSTVEEEARGIDGYIGDVPVSIKPESYRTMSSLTERLEGTLIFYTKKDSGIVIEFDF